MTEENNVKASIINPQRQISEGIVFDLLLKHKNAMYKSYFGQNIGEDEEISDNKRVENQTTSLREMISSQILIIDLAARPTIERDCRVSYNKKYKTDDERKENPFEKEENDFKKLMKWRDFLSDCLQALRDADATPSLEDDFKRIKTNSEGEEEQYLTNNFYEMRDDLAYTYQEIYGLLIDHEIVARKGQEDEDITYKEQEELFLERFKEA